MSTSRLCRYECANTSECLMLWTSLAVVMNGASPYGSENAVRNCIRGPSSNTCPSGPVIGQRPVACTDIRADGIDVLSDNVFGLGHYRRILWLLGLARIDWRANHAL